MKYIISLFCFSLILIVALALTIRKRKQSAKVEKILEKYRSKDEEGYNSPIYITTKGTYYIFRTSKKTGKEYKYYLPKDVQETIKKESGL